MTTQRVTSPASHRADIDGLRAVAVLVVVFNHLGTRFTGGFIGVDVFFVISGYLISGMMMAEMAQEKFSLAGFYERRVRRIIPALVVMAAVVSIPVYRLFVPLETVAYGKSLVATLLSVSNFLFWGQSGYFDAASSLKPLLHTWSLAVEEQFYIFFPLFLMGVRRWFPTRIKDAILVTATVSLIAAAVAVPYSPQAAFYFSPLRGWELLAGTILSQHYLRPIRSGLGRNLASFGGLLLILVPALKYTDGTQFPGLAAIPPVLGAALIIAAGETGSSLVGRVLSWRPMVFVGLISYSLYLWHWPIIVFQNTASLFFPGVASSSREKLLLLGISLALGALSWRFVEQPFRKGAWRPNRSTLLWWSGVAVAGLAFAGLAMIVTHGWQGRFPPEALPTVNYTYKARTPGDRDWLCVIEAENQFSDLKQNGCLDVPDGRPSMFVLGDSHAGVVWPGLARVYPDRQLPETATAGCRPLLKSNMDPQSLCRRVWDFLYHDLLPRRHFDSVALVGRWQKDEIAALGETVTYLKELGQQVIVIGPTPEFDVPEPRLLGVVMRYGNLADIERYRSTEAREIDHAIAHLAKDEWHVRYISMFDDLCTPKCAVFSAPHVPLLFDRDHLTLEGSVMLATAIRELHQLP